MNLFFNSQFPFSNYEHLYNILIVLLKSLSILLCALFPFLLRYFRYIRASDDEHPPFEEDYNEALQEIINIDEIETPFSTLTFRFPTYEEFLKTTENVDLVGFDTSSESVVLEEHCSIPSNPDPDFNLHPKEVSENLPPNDLDCTDDVVIDDDDGFNELDDSIKASKVEDSAEVESEDEEFIKALKTEIMKAKAKCVLQSIPEESEYIITNKNDLKPWKKEESFNYRDLKKQLHKFHKLYTEKMRKYDTVNHQKTSAKELKRMQSKEPVESVISRGFCACKPEKKTGENRGIDKDDDDGELELVYVMQLWVSWEFMVWQYKKSLEIYGREGYGRCRFNQVSENFEHFKVMIQRFMENEAFDEGSRVQCYVRNRLARRKLLQVPLLQEDEVKDKKNKGGKEEDEMENAIQIDKLIQTQQESIRILWQFIQKDKLVHTSTLNCHLEPKQEYTTSPSHSKIHTQILLDLQKKERRLRKIVKRKKCKLLKNCKEDHLEDEEDDETNYNEDELCFLTMVDLKLVSRMLNMKRITRNNLSLCHHKLSCITFPNGKIKVQPSSFLFSSL